jgi:hypothetical protein
MAGVLVLAAAAVVPRAGAAPAARLGLVVPRYLVAGGEPAEVLAQVLDAEGNPAPDGTVVSFVATLGLSFQPGQATTVDGIAATSLAPDTEAGFARIDAVSGALRRDLVLWVRPGPATHVLWLRSEPPALAPGTRSQVVARLTDAYGNPAEGDRVRWSADGGTVSPGEGRILHGQAETSFEAGPLPGSAWVRLESAGPTARVAIPVRGPLDRSAMTAHLHLPWLEKPRPARRGCQDVLAGGSFEEGRAGGDLPDEWQAEPGDGRVSLTDEMPAEGALALRLAAEGAPAAGPVVRQRVAAVPPATNGLVRLWLRGRPLGAELRLALWATADLGGAPTRVPLLVAHLTADEADWTLHTLALPAVPTGALTAELSVVPPADGSATVDVDAVRLELCR